MLNPNIPDTGKLEQTLRMFARLDYDRLIALVTEELEPAIVL
jgi:hypothetical protein